VERVVREQLVLMVLLGQQDYPEPAVTQEQPDFPEPMENLEPRALVDREA